MLGTLAGMTVGTAYVRHCSYQSEQQAKQLASQQIVHTDDTADNHRRA